MAIVSFPLGVADQVRDAFERGEYQDCILPLTVLRRLDGVMADTKEKVLATRARLEGKGARTSTPVAQGFGLRLLRHLARDDLEGILDV